MVATGDHSGSKEGGSNILGAGVAAMSGCSRVDAGKQEETEAEEAVL